MPNEHAHIFNIKELEIDYIYKLMVGSVAPRPIAWISSKSKKGTLNLAPFSFFTVASRNPPTLAVSIGSDFKNKTRTGKDTLRNIHDMNEYVINVVPENLANNMYESSRAFNAAVDEFKRAGLTPKFSETTNIPSVQESPIAFECKTDRIIDVGNNHLILGQINRIHIDQMAYCGDYKIDNWNPLARLAGNYASLSSSFNIP